MPFTNGRVSFTRLLITPGPADSPLPTRTLTEPACDALNDNAFSPTDVGVPLETETGWTTAAHLEDTNITYPAITAASGEAAILGLRIDTNTPPADIRRAVRARHEHALAKDNPSGKPSRAQRQEAKAAAEHELHQQMARGQHRRSAHNQLLWDIPNRTILSAAASNKATEALAEAFRTTFPGSSLTPASAGNLGYRHLAFTGRDRDFEDIRPSPFTDPPPTARPDADQPNRDTTTAIPDCPWARTSAEPRDFLGNELLIWLWHLVDQREGLVSFPDPDEPARDASLAITLDRTLELECAWGIAGRVTIKDHAGGPAPIRTPEAAEALSLGKWPRKSGLVIADNSTGQDAGQVWSCTLQADRWIISAAALPNPPEQENAEAHDTPEAEREFRIDRTLRLDRLLLALYHHFLERRTDPTWDDERAQIRRWIADHRRRRVRGLTPVHAEPKPAAEDAPQLRVSG